MAENKNIERQSSTLDKVLSLDFVIAGIALIVLIIITFAGVIMRYAVKKPITWGEEMQLFCFVWAVFFGGGAAFRLGGHVAIDVVVDMFPDKLKKIVEVCIYIVVILVLLYLLKQSSVYVGQMIKTKRTTNILNIPYYIIYGSLPVGCVLMIINYTITMVRDLKGGE